MDLVDRDGAVMSAGMAEELAREEAALRRAEPRAVLKRTESVGKRVAATKARHVYQLNIGGKTHEVVIDVSKLTGKSKLSIDGEKVEPFRRSHSRTLPGAHTLDVKVERKFLRRRPSLVIDGMKFKRLPLHRPASWPAGPDAAPPPPPPPPPLELRPSGAGGLLASAEARSVVAAAVPETKRERALDRLHVASEDGYDLDRALAAATKARLPAVVVVSSGNATFGCYLSRVPALNENADDVDAALLRLAPSRTAHVLSRRPASGFVVAARTTAFLAVGLDAASGGAALRLHADLAAGTSDPAAAFASPRLHGGRSDAFSVADVEVYVLRPLW